MGWLVRIDKNPTENQKDVSERLSSFDFYRFESGIFNKEMKKGYKFKEYDNEYAAQVFKNCMNNGIQTVLFLIVGYPTETAEDFEETMKFLKKYRKWISIFLKGFIHSFLVKK